MFKSVDLTAENSDRPLLDLIRHKGPLTVADMAADLGVTPTAIRNRLVRLVGSGMVERQTEHGKRGRPRHTYQASPEAHRRLGQNYADLAVALWAELMHSVPDRKLRRVLFARITDRLAELYRASPGRGLGGPARAARDGPARAGHRGRSGAAIERSRPALLATALVPVLRARRDRSGHLRAGAENVREGARSRPAALSVPARRAPLLRLRGQVRDSFPVGTGRLRNREKRN